MTTPLPPVPAQQLAAQAQAPILEGRPHGRKNIYWWGMALLIVIEITLFSLLIAAYFFMKMRSPAWPPEEIGNPSLLVPTINTGVLIVSGLAMNYGDRAIRKGNNKGLLIGQTVALLLAIVFVALKYYEYFVINDYDWTTHAYGSLTWLMAGFHTAHVISVFLKGLLMYVLAWMGTYTKEDHVAIEVNGLYWAFVVVIWIPLYLTIYISPHL